MMDKQITVDNEKTSQSDGDSMNTDFGTPISCVCCDKPSCRRLWRNFNNYWRFVGMFFAVFFYTIIGGAIFSAVERPNELRTIRESREARDNSINAFVDFLTNSTNLTEEEAINVTELFLQLGAAAAEAEVSLSVEENPIWDFASAVFFTSTVITTIGYGTIAPSTGAGQILFIFYAVIGIPLALLFLTQIGKIIEVWVNRMLKPVEERWGATVSRAAGSASLLLVVVIFFMIIPAAIYTRTETWNYRESVYFTVATLTTVGFGDFVPSTAGQGVDSAIVGLYKIITSVWLWMGLALVSALISEIQDLLSALGKWCHKTRCCCGVLQRLQLEAVEKQELAEVGTAPPGKPVETATMPPDTATTPPDMPVEATTVGTITPEA